MFVSEIVSSIMKISIKSSREYISKLFVKNSKPVKIFYYK